ncbi:MAG: response regulator [Litorilituus sp.]|nr:response regulator [Litorilituus sp.]
MDVQSSTTSNVNEQNTILIVEDNKLLRNLMKEVLSVEHIIIEASNGEEAIKIAMNSPPCLIITDINMPIMGGLELLKKLTENNTTKHIPLILISSSTEKKKTQKGLKLGAIDYVTKPFDINTLSQKVNNVLNILTLQAKTQLNHLTPEETISVMLTPDLIFDDKLSISLEKNFPDNSFTVIELAKSMAMSERQLQRKCNKVYGYGPSFCLQIFRLRKAKTLLLKGISVTKTAELTGFDSQSYFSRCFKKAFVISPKKFAQAHINTEEKNVHARALF